MTPRKLTDEQLSLVLSEHEAGTLKCVHAAIEGVRASPWVACVGCFLMGFAPADSPTQLLRALEREGWA